MNVGDPVKFSEEFLEQHAGGKNARWDYKSWRGHVVKFSGKNDLYTHVKWVGRKTPSVQYHCTFIIKDEERIMSGEQEQGTCEACKTPDQILQRTTFRYDLKCECHSPHHFEMIRHCSTCVPIEPKVTNVTLKTKDLPKVDEYPRTNLVHLIGATVLKHQDSGEASTNIAARKILVDLYRAGYRIVKQEPEPTTILQDLLFMKVHHPDIESIEFDNDVVFAKFKNGKVYTTPIEEYEVCLNKLQESYEKDIRPNTVVIQFNVVIIKRSPTGSVITYISDTNPKEEEVIMLYAGDPTQINNGLLDTLLIVSDTSCNPMIPFRWYRKIDIAINTNSSIDIERGRKESYLKLLAEIGTPTKIYIYERRHG